MKKILIFAYRAIPAIILLVGIWLVADQSMQWLVLVTSILLVYPVIKLEGHIFTDDR